MTPHSVLTGSSAQVNIEGDDDEPVYLGRKAAPTAPKKVSQDSTKPACAGFILELRPGQHGPRKYPHILHDEHRFPWTVEYPNNGLALRSNSCNPKYGTQGVCIECRKLAGNHWITTIQRHILHGVPRTMARKWFGLDDMEEKAADATNAVRAGKLTALNMAKALTVKHRALDFHKRAMMLISQGKVKRVDSLVRVALQNGAGIRGIFRKLSDATANLSSTKSFTDDDMKLAYLVWKMGGPRLVNIVARALGAPVLDICVISCW